MMDYSPFPKTIHLIVMLPETLLDRQSHFLLITARSLQILILCLDRFDF